jgi:hypothetical protein
VRRDGVRVGAVVSFVDVTARDAAAQALRAAHSDPVGAP